MKVSDKWLDILGSAIVGLATVSALCLIGAGYALALIVTETDMPHIARPLYDYFNLNVVLWGSGLVAGALYFWIKAKRRRQKGELCED